MTNRLWHRETFVEKLRVVGARLYHDKHPFHVSMNEGLLSPDSLRGWVANRFYYQKNIPLKDAAILSNCPVREVRRIWIHRILDHDGLTQGGRTSWAAGMERSQELAPPMKAASKHGCDWAKRAAYRAMT